jgi:hypothetical protein
LAAPNCRGTTPQDDELGTAGRSKPGIFSVGSECGTQGRVYRSGPKGPARCVLSRPVSFSSGKVGLQRCNAEVSFRSCIRQRSVRRTRLSRYPANTTEDMQKLLIGYLDNMRVEVEQDIPVTARTVADLRALSTWPDDLVLSIHVDLDPRLSVVRVERAS